MEGPHVQMNTWTLEGRNVSARMVHRSTRIETIVPTSRKISKTDVA